MSALYMASVPHFLHAIMVTIYGKIPPPPPPSCLNKVVDDICSITRYIVYGCNINCVVYCITIYGGGEGQGVSMRSVIPICHHKCSSSCKSIHVYIPPSTYSHTKPFLCKVKLHTLTLSQVV